jgi:hypothetical protein
MGVCTVLGHSIQKQPLVGVAGVGAISPPAERFISWIMTGESFVAPIVGKFAKLFPWNQVRGLFLDWFTKQ